MVCLACMAHLPCREPASNLIDRFSSSHMAEPLPEAGAICSECALPHCLACLVGGACKTCVGYNRARTARPDVITRCEHGRIHCDIAECRWVALGRALSDSTSRIVASVERYGDDRRYAVVRVMTPHDAILLAHSAVNR